jgi:hypothetical protein
MIMRTSRHAYRSTIQILNLQGHLFLRISIAPNNNPPDHSSKNLSKEATQELCDASSSAKILPSVRFGVVTGAVKGALRALLLVEYLVAS